MRQPLFYKRPEPLDSVRHKGLGIAPKADFSFAETANAVMLTVMEFALASRTYPIVFTTHEDPSPVAILGVRRDENLFVTDGQWEKHAFVPAYIRRYPFAFLESADKTRLILCVDVEAPSVTTDAETKFFDADGKPSAFTSKALEFCRQFQAQHDLTRRLCEVLKEHDLLEVQRADITLPGGEKTAVADFMVANEKKLNELPDELFIKLRKSGLLPFLYFHLMSLTNFRNLAERAAV